MARIKLNEEDRLEVILLATQLIEGFTFDEINAMTRETYARFQALAAIVAPYKL